MSGVKHSLVDSVPGHRLEVPDSIPSSGKKLCLPQYSLQIPIPTLNMKEFFMEHAGASRKSPNDSPRGALRLNYSVGQFLRTTDKDQDKTERQAYRYLFLSRMCDQ